MTAIEPTPAGGAGDEDGASVRLHAGRLELVHAQRGGEAGGAQDHGGAGVEAVRQRNGPAGRDADFLAEAARRVHAEVEADGDDRVSRREAARRRLDHRAGGVDPRRVREVTGDARIPGRRESVLVVERGECDVDQEVAGGQVGDVALDDAAGKLPVFGLLDLERAKRRHLFSFTMPARQAGAGWPSALRVRSAEDELPGHGAGWFTSKDMRAWST